jgi:hypothetical protein
MFKTTLLLVLAFSCALVAQTTFMRNYGQDDYSSHVVQTADGGFLVAGWSKSCGLGGWDTHVIKTDEKGDVLWDKCIGDIADDQIEGLVETPEGHYVLGLFTNSGGAQGYDLQLLKLDASGEEIWTRNYRFEKDERCNAIVQLKDGGFVIAGNTNSFTTSDDCFILRTDAEGNQMWYDYFGHPASDDNYRDVVATPDGGFALIGTRLNKFYLVKYADDNTCEWLKECGGGQACIGMSLVQLDDGGYITVGFTGSWYTLSTNDVLVVRTDAQGNEIWNKTFGGAKHDLASMVKRTPDGNVVILGRTASFGGQGLYDIYLLKINMEGDLLWQRTFDSGLWDEGWGLDVTTDGGLIIAGSSIHGDTYDNGKMWLIRTNGEGVVTHVDDEKLTLPESPELHQNYPNPFNPTTTIEYTLPYASSVTLKVYNLLGREVRTLAHGQQAAGSHSVVFEAGELTSTIYFYKLQTDSFSEIRKMLLVR